jgi:hypothetical protein
MAVSGKAQEPASSFPPTAAVPSARRVPAWFLVGLILALTFAAYLGTLWFHFVFDDSGQVLQDRYVHSWRYLRILFTKQVWIFVSPPLPANYYRPIFLFWLLLNHTVFGLNPMGWHLATVLVHLAVTLMVYWLAHRLAHDRWIALTAALIFGLHPTHIESVAWVSGVTDPLLALSLLPSFMFYVNWRDTQRRRWLLLSLFFYALALLSKETGVILPILIFLYNWIWVSADPAPSSRVRRWGRRLRTAVLPALTYVSLTLLYVVVRSRVLGGFAHPLTLMPVSTMIFTWPSLLLFYIKHLVWPVGLCAFVHVPYVTRASSPDFLSPLAIVVAVAIGLWAWHHQLARRAPGLARVQAFACVWLVVPLMPLADLSLLARGEVAHDRYLYLPIIGFGLLVGLALRPLSFSSVRAFGEPAMQWVAFLLLAAVLGTLTSGQDLYWANNLLFFTRGAEAVPTKSAVVTNLADVYGGLGQYGAALRLYHQVLAGHPGYWPANYNLGYTDYRLGDLAGADKYLRRAVAIKDTFPNAFFFLGLTALKRGDNHLAEALFRRAIHLDPSGLAYHLALGLMLRQDGNLAGALRQFQLELAYHPHEKVAAQQIRLIERAGLKPGG